MPLPSGGDASGGRLVLVGSCRELGEWDPGRGLALAAVASGGWAADVQLDLGVEVTAKVRWGRRFGGCGLKF